jgi:CRISPR-associated endonuclease/helicase Cas3
MATANAMFSRLVPVYTRLYMHDEKPSIVLAHGSRHLSKEFLAVASSSLPGDASEYHQGDHTAEATSIAWLSDNRKKALLAPVGVGTIDQALMAVLPFRHQSLRLLGLCRNVLIVDEVHAYDRYMQVVLKELLEFTATFGGSAILLSATLPIAIKNELVQGFLQGLSSPGKIDLRNPGYPLVTSVTSSGIREDPLSSPQHQRRTIRIELIEMKSTDIQTPIERLSGIIQSGQCACWVRNTVDDAVEASKQLSALFGRENILLFHARFTLEDRLRIEKKVLSLFGKEYDRNGRKGKIVVATQVVEHSLDLDFDFMVTDLAPIDLIIQRSGRLHRHPDLHPTRGSPVLSVLIPPVTDSPGIDYYQHVFPRGAYVYPHHGQLWLTAKILKESGQIVVPDDFRPMIEAVYGKEAQTRIPQVLKEKEHRAIAEESGDAAIANLSLLKVREGYRRTPIHWQDELRTSTRLTEATVQVVLFKWMGNTLSFWSSDPDYPWDMSEVQVPARWITSSADDYPPGVAEALDSMLKKLPDEGQWRIPIVLFINEQGKWEGRAKNHEGQIIRVSYDSEIGLQILR